MRERVRIHAACARMNAAPVPQAGVHVDTHKQAHARRALNSSMPIYFALKLRA